MTPERAKSVSSCLKKRPRSLGRFWSKVRALRLPRIGMRGKAAIDAIEGSEEGGKDIGERVSCLNVCSSEESEGSREEAGISRSLGRSVSGDNSSRRSCE
jgi:hypothetical protein